MDFTESPIDCADFAEMWGTGGDWAVSSVASISESMSQIKENHELALARAAVASEIIRDKFSWDKAAEKGIDSLRNRGRLKLRLSLNI